MCETIIEKKESCGERNKCTKCSEAGITVRNMSKIFFQLSFYHLDTCKALNFGNRKGKRADCIYFIKKERREKKVYCIVVELKKDMQRYSLNNINDTKAQFEDTKALIKDVSSRKGHNEKSHVSLVFVIITKRSPHSSLLRQARPLGNRINVFTIDDEYWKLLKQKLS